MEKCEICEKEMSIKDYNYCDICPDCLDSDEAELAKPIALEDMMEAGMFIPNELKN